MQCPSCQTQLSATAKFCGVCGTTIDNASSGAFSRVAAAAAAASAPATSVSARQYSYSQPVNSGGISPIGATPNLEKKYKALRTIAVLLKILAFLSAASACLYALFLFLVVFGGAAQFSNSGGPNSLMPAMMLGGIMLAIVVIVFGAIVFTFLYGLAEIIHLFIDIEENTRRVHQQLLAQTNGGSR